MSLVDSEFADAPPAGMTKEQAFRARESLRSVARRVVSQQMASLIKEESGSATTQGRCNVELLTIQTQASEGEAPGTCEAYSKFEDPIHLESPDKKYTVNVVASNPDWKNETFKIGVNVMTNGQQSYGDLAYNFELGWFDFPMTDNTLLPDGNRFAFNLVAVNGKTATVRLIWFPKNYFTPRERPLDYREYLKLVGKQEQGS